jgi:alpha-glucosidase
MFSFGEAGGDSSPGGQSQIRNSQFASSKFPWWQTGIVYQVYPRSFKDANGDGVGDLPGIIEKLDYLHWLNIDAVWISPIYPSPMADFGYDVSDYTGVHPMFGTLDDVARLVSETHGRGMKLILDFVPNHTSEEHPWFVESRSSRDNPKRDWYVWADPAPGGGPPNNWLSGFGVGRAHGAVLLPLLPQRAARPQLAQPTGSRGDAQRDTLLAR